MNQSPKRLRGKSLASTIASRGQMPWQKAVAVFLNLARFLDSHSASVQLASPLTPDRVRLTAWRKVELVEGEQLPWTNEDTAIEPDTYTLSYMSPEACYGKPQDARSTIYSFGCIFYETLTGTRPFTAATQSELRRKHLFESPQFHDTVEPQIPPALQQIILRCLSKTPKHRFRDFPELIQALSELTDGSYANQICRFSSRVSKVSALSWLTLGSIVVGMVSIGAVISLQHSSCSHGSENYTTIPPARQNHLRLTREARHTIHKGL